MNNIQVPVLNRDIRMKAEFNRQVDEIGRIERRIVYCLGRHLEEQGFKIVSVWDSEETTFVNTIEEAMEFIFDLDDCQLQVQKQGYGVHSILLVLGNGYDIISDYSFHDYDTDKFNAAMEAFDAENC